MLRDGPAPALGPLPLDLPFGGPFVQPVPPVSTPLPVITFPESLPVSGKRDEIEAALREHQVVIVCGETGSGKTTQLPKIAMQMGRGGWGQVRDPNAPRHLRPKLIGHTQPRRIAASSVAKRIAEELNTPLGEVVGYKVRFQDRIQPGASVKLMTDGILLAETQGDPDLRAYDTIIIDEAHERSLNIDFLLGYLRQLLPRRPDLKIIVTSATIDADRFAQHFASAKGPAPVIMVSGRLFPVEQRYRPFEESREYGLNEAITDAADELWREGNGDILVFLPGEREIREAADHLRKHFANHRVQANILPLFARLSQQEQDEVFRTGGGRRIVLATNVAETSLTVPGIRYVIDSGLARVKRYSFRNKVEQLQIEPISQAAANQRAGRCGRVANGICIRLYDEKDFTGRPRFTDPEILRSSLAGVILRMKSLHLGLVDDFPFIEPPLRKAIADGYQLLNELGAVDDANEITKLGMDLARLPLDPRVGRMILEAKDREALAEVLVIAASLSVQDVRDRPIDQQQQADTKHKQFDDERSEFMGTIKLWKWLDDSRGGHGHHEPGAPEQHKLSHRKYEQLLRDNFINPRRVREWKDVYSQLHTVVAEHSWRLNGSPATYEQVHLSLLSGLLGNIGCKSDDEDWYLGARGIKFYKHPGANLSKKPGRWILAAELVETTRLFGRGIANIEQPWLVQMGGHLLKKQLLDPHWEKKAGEVVALERATLYGLVVYNNKRINFGLIDVKAAREIFIREALVGEEWETRLPFLAANRKLIAQVEQLEHKSRRQDVLVDDELIHAFYDAQIPPEVICGASFERWYRHAARENPKLLYLSREELMRHEAAGITSSAFPKVLRVGGVDCTTSFLHQPGDARDGVTVSVPLFALNQVSDESGVWLVPGMLKDKVLALVKSLHQRPRSRLVPLPDYAQSFVDEAPFGQGSLMEVLLKAVRDKTQLDVKRADFKLDTLSPHLFMNYLVIDEHGRQLGMGRNLPALKAELGALARGAFQALAALKTQAVVDAGAGGVAQVQARGGMGQAGLGAAARGGQEDGWGAQGGTPAAGGGGRQGAQRVAGAQAPTHGAQVSGQGRGGSGHGGKAGAGAQHRQPQPIAAQPLTDWTFGELPELMEISRGGHTLIGFPALIDKGQHVEIEVFDEPDVAAAKHRAGLRRLVALQIKEPLKYLEKNIPDLQKMAMAYMPLGTADELREQIIDVALDRAYLADPLPKDAASFKARVEEGRTRLNLIAQEVARLAGSILIEYAAAARKLKDARPPKDVLEDITAQLQRLMPKRFVAQTSYPQLQHFARYLKGITLRLDKLKGDPARDAQRMAELRPQDQRLTRRLAELKGTHDARLDEFRWLLEELRISLFAQELRTPQPVSIKRLDKVWAQMSQ
jgi:ATP-dependent helicase HrpA